MTDKTKFELTTEFIDLMDRFEQDPDNFELAMALNDLEGEIKQKADQCAFMLQELGENEEIYKARKKYYDGIRKENADAEKTCHNKAKRINDSLLWMLKETGNTDLMTDNFKFKVGGVGGKRSIEYKYDDPEDLWTEVYNANEKIGFALDALYEAVLEEYGMMPFLFECKYSTGAIRNELEKEHELPFARLADKKEKVRIK